MNYFGNGPKTEATGRLRHMAVDVVALLLEVVFGGALLWCRRAGLMVAPIAKKLHLEFSVRLPTCQLMDDSGNYGEFPKVFECSPIE